MKQIVINQGTGIFEAIQHEIRNATKEILVVSAWFTDEILLSELTKKAALGLTVKVALSENKDNEKLDFTELIKNGGTVNRVKKKGYGMLHEKYCVIDQKIAFHGSYNWTNNAKKNNTESVIKTDHKYTVNQLITQFKMLNNEKETLLLKNDYTPNLIKKFLKPKIKEKREEEKEVVLVNQELKEPEAKPETKVEFSFNAVNDIDEMFESIISSEIKKTNRNEIKEMAYSQAQEVSGDSQIITKSMDSLYHLFISDKNENEINKEVLLSKIDNKVLELNQNTNTQKDDKIHSLEIEINTEEKNLNFQKTALEGKIEAKESKKKNVLEQIIPDFKAKITKEKDIISSLDIQFVKPSFKWHEFIPLMLFFAGLSFAMILFYSSSAYIMLYSYEDAMLLLKNGIPVNPKVFEENAISKSFQKSSVAGLYIIFFVFIPFTIAYVAHSSSPNTSNTQKWLKKGISYFVVILIDMFIAIKVTSTINEIKFLSTGVSSDHSVFLDINFWLVFFLGAIPFFFLAEIMTNLIHFFSERNQQTGKEKMLVQKEISNTKINSLNVDILNENKIVTDLEIETTTINNDISQLEQKLISLPKELDLKKRHINEYANNKIAELKNKADVYKNDIENDNVKISMTSLKDRVSAFIEGWNEWLHDEYSISKATKKSEEAIKESDLWIEQNTKKIELK
ncbi:phospholipase D-like domain-containing protein [Tenacibaculum dicentrarchi]|uniref:phospholipase D-like domain-containing protein n=1 Tax=Tenacibaculum dicentrarchi TaxID=669041 RepID=UPI0035111965